jgi:hypothetical protein
MDEELVRSFVLSAKTELERAQRWAIALVGLAAVFHILVYSPYLEAQRELAAVRSERPVLEAHSTAAESIGVTLQGLVRASEQIVSSELNDTRRDLTEAFDTLTAAIALIRDQSPPALAWVDRLTEAVEDRPQVQAQIGPDPGRTSAREGPTAREIAASLSPATIEMIQSGVGIAELREGLAPYVSDAIVGPRFDELNEIWNAELAPQLRAAITGLRGRIGSMLRSTSGQVEFWRDLDDSLVAVDRWVEEYRFEPPADSLWWQSVAGKVDALDSLGNYLMRGFSAAVESRQHLAVVQEALRLAVARSDSMAVHLMAEIDSAEDRMTRLSESLSGTGGALRIVAVDLEFVVRRFPLLLGGLLGLVTVWPAYRKRALGVATRLLPNESEERRLIEQLHAGNLLHQLFAGLPGERGVVGKDKTRIGWQMATALVLMAWIGIAAWPLFRWGQVTVGSTITCMLGGWALVLAGLGVHWRLHTEAFAPEA